MSEQHTGDPEGGIDPQLVEVVDKYDLKKGGTTLHRLDDDAGCSNRPKTNTRTDLTTAAVMDGHTLCNRCEWPDGAEEVLHD